MLFWGISKTFLSEKDYKGSLSKPCPAESFGGRDSVILPILDFIKNPVRLAHYGARRRRAPRLVQNLTRLRRYEKPLAFHEILV